MTGQPEQRVTDPTTGGQKCQKQERYDLVPYDAMDEICRVYSFGCRKYDDWNWLKGYKWSLSHQAMMRHISCWSQGENRDKESQLHHLAHAAWHCLTLLAYHMRGLGIDDRKPTAFMRQSENMIDRKAIADRQSTLFLNMLQQTGVADVCNELSDRREEEGRCCS